MVFAGIYIFQPQQSMDNSGFITLHRKIRDWEWYTNGNAMRVFIELLLLANHTDKKWQGIIVPRGSLITSQPHLSKNLRISLMQTRNSLNKLKSTGEITVKVTNKYSLISITNYNQYQTKQQTNQQSDNRQVTTTNNDNNDNNITSNTARPKKSSKIDEKDKVSNTKLKVEDVKLFVDKRLYPTMNSYIGEKELKFLVELYNKTEKTPYNKSTWLRDVSWIELIPLGLEVGIFAENLVKLANSFYPKYQSGYTVRDKRKIKNFYQFFSGIVRKEQINYRNRYDWFTWNVPPV